MWKWISKYSLLLVVPLCFSALGKNIEVTPYVGAGIGPDYSAWNRQSFTTETSGDAYRNLGLSGWQWQGYLGVRLTLWQRLVLSTEFFGGTVNSKSVMTNSNQGPNHHSQFIKNNIGIAELIGPRINFQFPYLKLGAEWSELSSDTKITASNLNAFNFSDIKSGFMIGTGISAPLSKHLSIRTEYDDTHYKNIRRTPPYSSPDFLIVKPEQQTYWLSFELHGAQYDPGFVTSPLESGFQIGFGGARDMVNTHAETDVTTQTNTEPHALSGYACQALIGWRFPLSHYFANALQFIASDSNDYFEQTSTFTIVNLNYSLKMHGLYALRDQFGYNTSPSNTFFVAGGIAAARFQRIATARGMTQLGPQFNTYRYAWLIGVGDQMALFKHLSYAIEGDYMRFGSIRPASGTNGYRYSIHPKVRRVSLSLIYTI